ncbi:ABC transporter permease [Prosthecochloris marina]|uniref:ABC transporter permease n=1 Tax=Prosthecochloris marina TaxID=2017681 RepID=A0A317T4B7_9CHLB|nr:ABC transporter permease subunit [Prosthecochloris marina]PWW81040.1 ABC transporter permease [Prosthecochloris marina]
MTWLIVSREIREFYRDGRFLFGAGLIVVLFVTAFLVGFEQRKNVFSEREVAQQLDYDDWINQPERHPHDAAHQGMHVFKPIPPLSFVDPGITNYVGSTQWLQAHRQTEVKFRPAQDATGLQRFGSLTPAWIIQMLGPLLIIILGFNSFSGEREQGTLRQLISLGVPSWKLLVGKAFALFLGALLLLAPLLMLAFWIAFGDVQAGDRYDVLIRLGLLVLGYLVYLGIFIFMVLTVSVLTPASRISLVVLLAVWIAGTILAPRVLVDVARTVYPTPNQVEFNAQLNQELRKEYTEAWKEHFGVEDRWGTDVPLSRWGEALQVDDQAGYNAIDRHFGALWNRYDDQQRLQEFFGFVFPMLSVRSYSMAITATDFSHHRDFAVSAEQHRRLMQNLISSELVEHADGQGEHHFDYKVSKEFWSRIPPFEYAAPSVLFALQRSLNSFAIMCATLLFSFVFALLSSRKLV